jgi:hypothetical protein
LFLVQYFLTKFPLRRATPARWIILLPAMTNYLRGPQFPRVHFSDWLLHSCGYILLRVPLLYCSRSFHCGLLPRDLLVLHSGVHCFGIWHFTLGSHQRDWLTVC